MSDEFPRTGWLRMGGDARALGRAVGLQGRAAVHRHLLDSAIWNRIATRARTAAVARMADTVAAHYPDILDEIEAMAEGLDLPFEEVFAWNCRGELLAASPDGCTTLMQPGETPVLAHNEDGLPFFRGSCFILEAEPEAAPRFHAFCYPGSLPGHTFAINAHGMVQTVNNLRLTGLAAQVPRMVLGRAVLRAGSIDEALDTLRAAPPSAGFHFTLAQCGDSRLTSVEFGAGAVSTQNITAPAIHANHALHHPAGLERQTITRSSRDRQARGTALLGQGRTAPLDILHDTGGPGLPIHRSAPDDPDDENTLATAIFEIGTEAVTWSVHDQPGGGAAYVRTLDRSA